MRWRDQAMLVTARKHGENKAILEVFSSRNGLHSGILPGGTSRKLAPFLQPGAQLDVEWKARLDEHMGTFRVEPVRSRAPALLADQIALAALSSACSLISRTLPEREPNPVLYGATTSMLDGIRADRDWLAAYLKWELNLLKEIGFALDFSTCAATGSTEDLRYVSPRTGRAVSAVGAGQWVDRLLPLPLCFRDGVFRSYSEIGDGLRTTGHFFEKCLCSRKHGPAVPAARTRFASAIEEAAAKE